jgi:hypothetical protein
MYLIIKVWKGLPLAKLSEHDMLEMKEDLIEGVGMVEAKELAIHDE